MLGLTKKVRVKEAKKRVKIITKIVPLYRDELTAYGAMMLENAGIYSTMEPEDYIKFMYSISEEMFIGNFMGYITNPLLWDEFYKLYKGKIDFLDLLEYFNCDDDELEIFYYYMEICKKYK